MVSKRGVRLWSRTRNFHQGSDRCNEMAVDGKVTYWLA